MAKTAIIAGAALACAAVSMSAPNVLRASPSDVSRYGRKEEAEGSIAELTRSIKEIAKKMTVTDKDIKEFAGTATEQIKAMGEMTLETKAALEKAAAEGIALQEKYNQLEQLVTALKSARGGGADEKAKTWGQEALGSAEFKSMREKGTQFKGTASHRIKAITSDSSGADGDAGDLIIPQRVPGIIADPNRRMVIRDLLSNGRTNSNAIEYVEETGFTNNAAPVAEGSLKPESSITFTLRQVGVKTIAHWIHATKQVLADVPMLMSYIDGRLRYGLELVEETQLLSGDGTGQNILGLIPQATPYDESRSKVGDTRIDIVRRAMTQVRLAEYSPDGIVMHPSDWEEIELTKDNEQRYIWANPNRLQGPTLWGLPVIETTAVEEGEFLVGNFKLAAAVWDREDANVEVSTEDRDNFIKNMVTIRAEERLALTVYRPEALIHGDFDESVST